MLPPLLRLRVYGKPLLLPRTRNHFGALSNVHFNDYILVALLRVSPHVKHYGEQEDDAQRYKLGQLVGQSSKRGAIDRGISWNEDEVGGDGCIREWQQRHNPGTQHPTGSP